MPFVFVDYLTKWPEVFATPDQFALTIVCLFVEQIVCRRPNFCLTAFLSQLMMEVCEVLGVKKINTTMYHPQTDGLVERFNQHAKERVERNGANWDAHLSFTLLTYKASIYRSPHWNLWSMGEIHDSLLLDIETPLHREEDMYKKR